ncbi:MAG: 4Fe-4S dicluster domain-containing protein [Planctomycetota bacterium]|nr:4Fe-4S dicluster domain-containing protein [Planctomycetota bacterium]
MTSHRVRTFTRLAALAVAVVLAAAVLPWPWAPMVVPAASPFVMIASCIALRAAGIVALVGFPVLVLALRRPRWFCRWACPVGLVEETLGRLRPSGATRFVKWPPVGQWIALVTLGGAAAGYPLLVWLDPLAMLAGFVGAWRWPLTVASVAAVGLPAVLVLSAVFPHAWCGRVCPLGAMQDLLAWPRQWLRRRAAAQVSQPSASAGWHGHAPLRDHDVRDGEQQGHAADGQHGHATAWPCHPAGGGLSRRTLLAAGLGGACGVAVRAAGGGTPALRPPGAIDESRFTGVCVRCGNCVRACPAHIIRPDLGGRGLAGLLAPEVTFAEDYCREDCRACTEVCPSGAISRLAMEEKRRFVIGAARVDLKICILARGEECTVCTRACSYEAISTPRSADGNAIEPRVDPARCVGCGACEVMCPTSPVKAIRVYPLEPRA